MNKDDHEFFKKEIKNLIHANSELTKRFVESRSGHEYEKRRCNMLAERSAAAIDLVSEQKEKLKELVLELVKYLGPEHRKIVLELNKKILFELKIQPKAN